MKNILLILALLGAGWKLYNHTGEVSLGPGVLAPDVPQQNDGQSYVDYKIKGYDFSSLAKFQVKAKVLSKKKYSRGREADISPVDLVLGWGNMSDESILKKIEISQSGRFYLWRVDTFPIPREEIETHSANMHIIPANDAVKREINKVRQGDIVELEGDLVKVTSSTDSWSWTSSRTRNDTGDGACELILVESLQVVSPI